MNDKKNTQNDDVVYDEETNPSSMQADETVVEEEDLQGLIKKLKEKIKICEKEKQEYMDGWQRERADFVNYKKRMELEKVETIKYANENLVSELLTVIESFDMAFSNKEAWEKVDKNWRVGVEYIHTQFMKVLKENNLKELNPIGEKFDPTYHVAEETREVSDEKEDGKIIEVKKKGYSLNDRILVAPNVVVGEFKKNIE
jgi:molecular chaperone GrpE